MEEEQMTYADLTKRIGELQNVLPKIREELGKDGMRLMETYRQTLDERDKLYRKRIQTLQQEIQGHIFALEIIQCPFIDGRTYCDNKANLNELVWWMNDVYRGKGELTPSGKPARGLSGLEELIEKMNKKGWVFDKTLCNLCIMGAEVATIDRENFKDASPDGHIEDQE